MKKKISFKYNFEVYWSFLKKYKKLIAVLLFLTLAIEALLVADKFLFKAIIDNGELFLAGTLASSAFIQILIIIGVIFGSIIIIRPIFKWLIIHFLNILDSNLMFDVKRNFFNHIVGLSQNFHSTHKTGSLISRLGRGVNAIEGMTDTMIFNFAPLIFQLVIVGFSIALFSIMPAIVILVLAISFISYSFIIQQIQQKSKLAFNDSQDVEKGLVGDVFANIESIKYFGKEKLIQTKFKKLGNRTRLNAVKYWNYFRWFDAGQIFLVGAGVFFLIYFPLIQFLNKEITLGTLVFIYTVYGNVVSPMWSFVWGMRNFYRSMADFEYLFEYGKIKNEIKDRPGAEEMKIQKGSINFENVSFNYGKSKRKIFHHFNLKIKPNEKIALVGHSGCGKSTLIKLLYRLYDVKAGAIRIDGKDIEEFKQESLRSEMSIVPQECILFDDTIYNNIKFSNPKATKAQVRKAIKFAQLDKIIKEFPRKEKTIVGERGVKLSGGEKQRVSIARALLADKQILVLDEATSSLDSETEYEIQKDLKNLLEGRTSIIIAHRLSTIMNADRIIVMKRGKIIEEGKHSVLLRKNGEYKRLWNLQKGGYIK